MNSTVGASAAKDISGKSFGMPRQARPVAATQGLWESLANVPVTADTTPFLYSHYNVLSLIRDRRWAKGLFCPRCEGRDVRKVNSSKLVDAFSCCGCQYNFNSVSGTFFHGSKIALHLQLRVVAAIDLLGETLRLSEISALTGISYKTAKLQYGRLATARPDVAYLSAPDAGLGPVDSAAGIMAVLERSDVALNLQAFYRRLDELLGMPGQVPDMALAS